MTPHEMASTPFRRPLVDPRRIEARSSLVLLLGGYFALFALAVLILGHGAPGAEVLVGIARLPFPVLALVLIDQARRSTSDPIIARGWQYLLIGQAFMLVGDLCWIEADIGKTELSAVVYVLWAGTYFGFNAAGFVTFMRAQRAEHEKWGDWLDASVMVVTGGMLAWYLLAREVTQLEIDDRSALALFFLTSASNISLLYLASAVWLRGPAGLQRRAVGWLIVGLGVAAIADLIYERREFTNTVVAGSWLDLLYNGAMVAIALAADAQRRSPIGPSSIGSLPRLASDAMPLAATGIALIPLLVESVRLNVAGNGLAGIAVGLVVLTLLVLGRQRLARSEIDTLVQARVNLEQQLWQSQKMEAVGRLAGGIAHDFNNILAVISAHAQLLRTTAAAGDGEELEEIEFAAQRAAALTRRLMAFSRTSTTELRTVSLDGVIRSMEPMMGRLLVSEVELAVDIGDDGVWVSLADGQLEQVLLNLAINARDAMPTGGKLSVTTRQIVVSADDEWATRGVPEGVWAHMAIADTGTGMDESTKARLFEPFFTTKARGHGTGLGLATVDGIVRSAGGVLCVDTAIGRGTTMSVFLPLVAAPVNLPVTTVSIEVSAQPVGAGTILVVDDESAIRRAICRFFERQGYEMLAADDGESALAQLHRRQWDVKLVLTDVQMPGMSGLELARTIHARAPQMPVLFMSGFVDGSTVAEIPEALQGEDVLMKPFDLADLGARVRESISSRAVDRVPVSAS